ncbi:MAG: quinolinate synthase [Flavobacteriales bacterium CG_4_9_14_0_2_um_filter_35_242]|nr:quinolinate synthase NadA [Zetaproteobacteria bacterium]OIO09545.1 MAG: quinolinate synthase [Flavobacteriaceae bacterium CG1_02_35_72]PJA05711.1 MAG: quinolinate synthase [Flavobacteriales bacterium CG_4_10_14_0_2_um_filter_35_18]PJC59200.1 MAG: quinolinate synthase [Flavobacteriales bacterium CG_4_9_14_0_2_um_filter_35_242]
MIAITKQITKNKLANTELSAKILQLKNEKNAVLLAHYYQEPEIQELADFVGDSLELSRQAASTNAKIIIFAGVHFMAETAKIINPNKTVIVPDLKASCSLAESCPPKEFKAFIDAHPGHTVITYINCSAEIKALSDLVCTSSNAEKIINSVPKNQPIIFAPDYNLGRYMIKKTGRDMVLWQGACIVHEAFSIDKILKLHKKHPQAEFIAHPESESQVLEIATYIGSTSGLIKYVKESQSQEFIVATEAGILYKMQMEVPDKLLIPAPANEDNNCACSECAFMKMNTLEKLYQCLKNEAPVVDVAEAIRKKALIPINRMLELSK